MYYKNMKENQKILGNIGIPINDHIKEIKYCREFKAVYNMDDYNHLFKIDAECVGAKQLFTSLHSNWLGGCKLIVIMTLLFLLVLRKKVEKNTFAS